MNPQKDNIKKLRENISIQKKISGELGSLYNQAGETNNSQEKRMVSSQVKSLKNSMIETNKNNMNVLQETNLTKPLHEKVEPTIAPMVKKERKEKLSKKEIKKISELELTTLKRLKEKKKVVVEKEKKPSMFVKRANEIFSTRSRKLLREHKFGKVERSIIKAKLKVIPASYLSVMFLSTIVASVIGLFLFVFFLFFNIQASLPLIVLAEGGLGLRFIRVFWILLAVPLGTFGMMYIYPSLEEKSAGQKINQELPFVTINMAAISGTMIDPSNIFKIIISTKEYPYIEKEFTRLMNEVDIYGYDLVNAMKSVASNSPSRKLADLLNGLATTISSGGKLGDFFEKRSESLLFEYKIDKEKYTKSAETFMDIYISVVIAAPMILMLLLMMMRVSGLGLSLSTGTITLMTVLGVLLINIIFLTFLHVRQPIE